MNAAQQIEYAVNGEMNTMDYTEALEFCNDMMKAVDQDWENECTTFEAADGSQIKFDGTDQTVKAL